VEITCEFCDSVYAYDQVDVEALFKGVATTAASAAADTIPGDITRH
jgi:hypothetical protein